jgi:HEAT repeat protein
VKVSSFGRFFLFSVTVILCLGTTQAQTPTPDVAGLIAKLADPDEGVRFKAAKDLGKLKEQAKDALDALKKISERDADEDVRNAAKKSVEAIQEALASTEKDKDAAIIQPLLKKLKSTKSAERIEALDELAKMGSKAVAASSSVTDLVVSGTSTVRDAALQCLEKIDPKCHPHIVTMLYDNTAHKRRDAMVALQDLGAKATGAVPALKSYYQSSVTTTRSIYDLPDYFALQALASIVPNDPAIINEVLLIVSRPITARSQYDTTSRGVGIALLDKVAIKNDKKVAALIPALDDPRYRLIVVNRLGKLGADAKPALPALAKLKTDPNSEVRQAAARAIEDIKAE